MIQFWRAHIFFIHGCFKKHHQLKRCIVHYCAWFWVIESYLFTLGLLWSWPCQTKYICWKHSHGFQFVRNLPSKQLPWEFVKDLLSHIVFCNQKSTKCIDIVWSLMSNARFVQFPLKLFPSKVFPAKLGDCGNFSQALWKPSWEVNKAKCSNLLYWLLNGSSHNGRFHNGNQANGKF